MATNGIQTHRKIEPDPCRSGHVLYIAKAYFQPVFGLVARCCRSHRLEDILGIVDRFVCRQRVNRR